MAQYSTLYSDDKNPPKQAGLRKLVQLSVLQGYPAAKIWVLAKQELHGLFAGNLTPRELAELAGGGLRLDGIELQLVTPRIRSFVRGPILGLFSPQKYWVPLVNNPLTTDFILVPWVQNEFDLFRRNYPDAQLVEV